jgi:hypothetical protein
VPVPGELSIQTSQHVGCMNREPVRLPRRFQWKERCRVRC